MQIVTATTTTIKSDWDPEDTESEEFDLRFDAPTSTTTGDQQSITVTGSIIKA